MPIPAHKYIFSLLLLLGSACKSDSETNTPGNGRNPEVESPCVHLGEILIRDTHEWLGKTPEIYIRCETNADAEYRLDLPKVDEKDTWYEINLPIGEMKFRGDEDKATCKVREDDFGSDGRLGTVKVHKDELSDTPKYYDEHDTTFSLYLAECPSG